MAITPQTAEIVDPGVRALQMRNRNVNGAGRSSSNVIQPPGTVSPSVHRANTLESAIVDFENRESQINAEILKSYSGALDSGYSLIRRGRAEERAGIDQDLGNRGLYNTSISGALKSRSREGEGQDIGNLAGGRASVLQTMRPNPNIYGPLIQQMAATPQKSNIGASLLPIVGSVIGSFFGPGGTALGGAAGKVAGGLAGGSGSPGSGTFSYSNSYSNPYLSSAPRNYGSLMF